MSMKVTNKFIAGLVAVVAVSVTSAAHANRDYRTTGFYAGAQFGLNLANFKLDHYFESNPSLTTQDSYSFAPQLGLEFIAGYQFAPRWRTELNYGYVSKFEDSDSAAIFAITSQHLMANVLFTMAQLNTTSIYTGVGAGATLLQSSISGLIFTDDGHRDQTKATYIGQFILGVEEAVTKNFSVGLSYAFRYSGGATHKREYFDGDILVTDISAIMTHNISAGVRIKF